jgi:hypothetical protein
LLQHVEELRPNWDCAVFMQLLRAIGTKLKLRLQIVASCWHTPEAEIFHEGFWAMLHA